MKTKYWLLIIAAFLVAIGLFFEAGLVKERIESRRQQIRAFEFLTKELESFHEEVGKIFISSTDRNILSAEASRICQLADDKVKEIEKIERGIMVKNADYPYFKEMMDRSKKYLRGFADFLHKFINKDQLEDRADSLINILNICSYRYVTTNPIDEPETKEAIARVDAMVKNKEKLQKTATQISQMQSRYWSDPANNEYLRRIRGIIASYSSGRAILSRVLRNYDYGILTTRDQSDWIMELNRRRFLLAELNEMEDEMPSGAIYAEYHFLLKKMLRDAISAMEDFASEGNYYTRRRLSEISSRNTTILKKIKEFYGVR